MMLSGVVSQHESLCRSYGRHRCNLNSFIKLRCEFVATHKITILIHIEYHGKLKYE